MRVRGGCEYAQSAWVGAASSPGDAPVELERKCARRPRPSREPRERLLSPRLGASRVDPGTDRPPRTAPEAQARVCGGAELGAASFLGAARSAQGRHRAARRSPRSGWRRVGYVSPAGCDRAVTRRGRRTAKSGRSRKVPLRPREGVSGPAPGPRCPSRLRSYPSAHAVGAPGASPSRADRERPRAGQPIPAEDPPFVRRASRHSGAFARLRGIGRRVPPARLRAAIRTGIAAPKREVRPARHGVGTSRGRPRAAVAGRTCAVSRARPPVAAPTAAAAAGPGRRHERAPATASTRVRSRPTPGWKAKVTATVHGPKGALPGRGPRLALRCDGPASGRRTRRGRRRSGTPAGPAGERLGGSLGPRSTVRPKRIRSPGDPAAPALPPRATPGSRPLVRESAAASVTARAAVSTSFPGGARAAAGAATPASRALARGVAASNVRCSPEQPSPADRCGPGFSGRVGRWHPSLPMRGPMCRSSPSCARPTADFPRLPARGAGGLGASRSADPGGVRRTPRRTAGRPLGASRRRSAPAGRERMPATGNRWPQLRSYHPQRAPLRWHPSARRPTRQRTAAKLDRNGRTIARGRDPFRRLSALPVSEAQRTRRRSGRPCPTSLGRHASPIGSHPRLLRPWPSRVAIRVARVRPIRTDDTGTSSRPRSGCRPDRASAP